MEKSAFIARSPFLYHLTDQRNLDSILASQQILSTAAIIQASSIENKRAFLRTRRPVHCSVNVGDSVCHIRDQRPISLKALSKCLTDNWDTGDFIAHLNKRVFFWPNIKRLTIHYSRYKNENPVILRFDSAEILELNPNAEFCRLNSGATRANSYLGGKPPARGRETFLRANAYPLSASSVAEVTFPNLCNLPDDLSIAKTPNGRWRAIQL